MSDEYNGERNDTHSDKSSHDELHTYQGACHCGAVTFEFDAPAIEATEQPSLQVQSCNCSICHMTGFLHIIVPQRHFRLKSGGSALSEYRFNTGVAKHTFCKICGVKSFYTPRSNPDGISVNARCTEIDLNAITIDAFDGQNWEKHAEKLKHLSK